MKGSGYVIWLIALVGLVAACQAAPELKIGDPGNVAVGDCVEVPIVLEGAEDGLSGYNLTVTLSDPACAEVSAVSFPAWAPLHHEGAVPAGETWIEAVDLGNRVGENGTGVALGTVTLRGIRGGSADLVIVPVRVQDDTGRNYQISEVKAAFSVGTRPGSAGHSGSSSSGGGGNVPGAAVNTPQPTAIETSPAEESTPTVTTSEVPTTVSGTTEETTPAQGAPSLLFVTIITALTFGFILREKKE